MTESEMSDPCHVEKNLLAGLFALKGERITSDQFVAALSVWLRQQGCSMSSILLAQGAIDAETEALLLQEVEKQLAMHENDIEKVLEALGVSTSALAVTGASPLLDESSTVLFSSPPHASQARQFPNEPPALGSTDGPRFHVLRPHAKGGLGQVSVALDRQINREVALKEIQPRYAGDSRTRQQFLFEAEVTGRLEHPGIVPVYSVGQHADGRPFYAMRFVRGETLTEAIEKYHRRRKSVLGSSEAGFQLHRLLRRFVDVCNAIDYAHSSYLVHRDLKPDKHHAR